MAISSWFRPLRSAARAASSRRPANRRPTLEALEDRCVPTTLTVTSADDNMAERGTLRYAVANAVSGDTILIAADLKNTPIVLTQGELLLNQSVTIQGVGNVPETVSGGGNSRLFEVAAGATVALENLTLTGGNGVAGNPGGTTYWDRNGGAVLNFGTLTASGCTFVDNTVFDGGGSGGAAFNLGTLILDGCTVYRNSAYFAGGGLDNNVNAAALTINNSTVADNFALIFGGGVLNQGTLTVSGSTFSGNSNNPNNGPFTGGGGAIFSTNFESATGVVTLSDCVFSGNDASDGAAVLFDGATLTATACTFTGTTAVYTGGAIEVGGAGGAVTVSGSTFTGNSAGVAGGAVWNAGVGTLTVSGSTFAANTPDNIFGPYTDGGGNTFF